MSDKKFTPGPWKAIFLTEHTGEELVLVIPTDVHGVHRGSGPICEVLSKNLDDADEISISNAKLIASAPDLYVALEKAVADYGKPGGPWNVPSEPGTWLEMAKNAIKKARGEE